MIYLPSPRIDPRRYGFKGDGSVIDDDVAINTAIRAAAAETATGKGAIVLLPQCRALTSAPVQILDNVHLEGVGRGGGGSILLPHGTFNAIEMHGVSAGYWANGRSIQGLEIDGTRGIIGNGLDNYACGLRCHVADLYIHDVTGIGMRIMSSFDHLYERVETRNNSSFGVQTYEKQAAYDGIYEEQSYLRFLDVMAIDNNAGTALEFPAVSGVYRIGEPVIQADSDATGIVTYFDVANLTLYLRNVLGVFDNINSVAGRSSHASGVPAHATGGSDGVMTFPTVAGAFRSGEHVVQTGSNATGIVTHFDADTCLLALNFVRGHFKTKLPIVGKLSGAGGVPSTVSVSVQNLVQWDCAGGDTFDFISVKASEGLIGLDFSRNCNAHSVRMAYFDSVVPGVGSAIRTRTRYCQKLDIDKVRTYQAQYGVDIQDGQNISIGTVSTDTAVAVNVRAGAEGPFFLKTPRTPFTDANVPQHTYPTENLVRWTPAINGNGAFMLGSGTLQAELYQHGDEISFQIELKLRDTTLPASGLTFSLPPPLPARSGEHPLAQVLACHAGAYFRATAVLAGTQISLPLGDSSSGTFGAAAPFPFGDGDSIIIAGTYAVN